MGAGLVSGLVVLALTGTVPAAAAQQPASAAAPVLGGGPAGRAVVPDTTAFVDVAVIPMDRERVLPHRTVVVAGGRVVALGPTSRVRVPAGATRVDGRGRFLLPGLADMHVHTRVNGDSAGFAATERALLLALANGVTTIRNMAGEPWHLTLRALAARGEILSPRIYTSGPALSNYRTDVLANPIGAVQASVPEEKAAGYDFIKAYGLSGPAFDTLIVLARRVGIRIVGHPPGLDDSMRAITPGILERALAARYASLEHLHGYYQYATVPADSGLPVPERHLDAQKLRAAAAATRRAGTWVCPTLTVWTNGAPLAHSWFYPIVKALQDGGVSLLLGTDQILGDRDAPVGPTIRVELQDLVAAGLTPYQALLSGTRNVAEFLGTQDSTGTVAIGKRADFLLLGANPLQDIRHTADVAGVMLGGRWLARATLDSALAVH